MVKVYVGNLSYDEDDESLKSLFSPYGDVTSAEVVVYRKSGKSRGFGFIEMEHEGAQDAIESLNEKEVNGRLLKVNISDPNVSQMDYENSDYKRIYVGNLKQDTDLCTIAGIFSDFGKVTSATLINDQETEEQEGFAFVEMSDNSEAIEAINELDGKEVEGLSLRVNWAKPRHRRYFKD